uniref:Uncharacterized protein n=2 Tax=Bradyrhizobium ottawaense TaxID=931866 RepID=A0A2U8P9I3_9BRAD|nr:hypothetical protein CIT37_21165 [Bradyrhizobium ottawaense]
MANAANSTVTAFRWLLGPGLFAAGAEIRNRSMLPGFRFLFAAILLSVSILVFGLGAAALLRASHEQYVSNPSWRNGPQEQVFAQAPEPAQPVLAVLRAEPEPTAEPEPSLRDKVPTIGLPESESDQVAVLTTETEAQSQVAAPPADVPVAEPAKAETTKTETTKPETTTEAAAPAPADTLTPADTTASIPAAEPAATASEPAPVDPSAALASSALDAASAKLAALNEPATTAVKDAPAKAKTESKADDKAAKRKAKVKKRHRVVRRPPPQQLQQQLDPFGQPQTFATTTTRMR